MEQTIELLKATCKEVASRGYMPREFIFKGDTVYPYDYLSDDIMVFMDDAVHIRTYTSEELYEEVQTQPNIFYNLDYELTRSLT